MSGKSEDNGSGDVEEVELGLSQHLAIYREEVLRWNQQINLITRKDSHQHLDRLVQQCLDGIAELPNSLKKYDLSLALADPIRHGNESLPGKAVHEGYSSATRITYLDLGSGAGLPGMIWHLWLQERQRTRAEIDYGRLDSFLVEPRAKRAWFLERTARSLGLEGLRVVAQRWEDFAKTGHDWGPQGSRDAGNERVLWLFTLKALMFSDEQILAGWRRMTGHSQLPEGDRLIICRFRPPGKGISEAERKLLCLPTEKLSVSPREPGRANAHGLVACGNPQRPSVDLLLSCYGGRI